MDSLRLRKHRSPISHDKQSRLELGSRIRALRKIHGWTLDDLARSIDVSKSAISQIESGRIEPSLQTLRRLASALKPPLARLFESPTASIDDRVVRRDQRKIFHLPKDHVRFRATSPHYVSNAGRHTAVTIWAISPPAY